ncbi:MAG TPA: hypothetical protein VG897_06915 [Terriglobales bacterium]|nr:hypothetical protein [Terriglobales bacterium]
MLLTASGSRSFSSSFILQSRVNIAPLSATILIVTTITFELSAEHVPTV